jgi:cytoskeletal protein RodZ
MRGVSLEELSSATRISTKYLTAIESGHWNELPGGAFNRGFIRSASRYLGLDEDGMVAEYSLEMNNGHGYAVPRASRRSLRSWDFVGRAAGLAVFLACVTVAGWFITKRVVTRFRSEAAAKVAPTAMRGARASAAAQSSASPLRLVVRSSSPARVLVISDGKAIFDGELEPKEVETFEARETFKVSAKDSSAVRLELNGQPVSSNGPAGQPFSVTLTAKDVKAPAGGAH